MIRAVALAALLWAWMSSVAAAQEAQAGPAEAPAGILVLSSYHQGDGWNDRLVAAFLAGLPRGAGPVYTESLDSRRLDVEGFLPELAALLVSKYARASIRLLVACDDAALDFWLAHGQALFPGRPLVFCGINDWNPDRIAGRTDVTGACESPDVLGTLELGLALLPRAGTIVVLADDRDPSGRANLARFRRAMLALGRRARAVELLDCTLEQAGKALAALPRDAVVLRLTSLMTESGRLPSREQSMRALLAVSPVPVLVLWDYDFGTGALGGRLVRAEAQGQAAAALAGRVLAGESPASLPVVDAPNQALVDHRALTRFGIAAGTLPPGTAIANQPPSVYQRYKTLIISIGVALAVLLTASILLGLTLVGRRAAEGRLRESEARYRELVDLAHSLILRFDREGRLVFANEYAERLFGHSREVLSRLLATPRANGPADLSGLLARAMLESEEPDEAVVEREIATADGRTVVVRWDSQALREADGSLAGTLVVGTDITARRRAEDILAARMLVEEALLAMSRDLLADGPDALARALGRLLPAFVVDRAVVMENFVDPQSGLCCRLRVEAFLPGLDPKRGSPGLDRIPYSLDAFRWAGTLEAGETIDGLAADFPESLQEILDAFGVRSVLAAPVTGKAGWWGFVAVGDTRSSRQFSRQERVQLAMAAGIVAAYLFRPGPAA